MDKKDWTGNSSTYISTNGFSNNSTHERQVNDYYATDPLAAEFLLEFGIPFNNIWENAVGGWHLASVFKKEGLLKKASDIIIREKSDNTEIIDFLQYNHPNSWDGDIVTNPPYKYAKEWALKSLETVKDGRYVALFLPVRYLEGKARRKELFDKFPPKYIYVSTSRIKTAINGAFNEIKGSTVTYTWMIWQKGYVGETQLNWFN